MAACGMFSKKLAMLVPRAAKVATCRHTGRGAIKGRQKFRFVATNVFSAPAILRVPLYPAITPTGALTDFIRKHKHRQVKAVRV